MYYHYFTMYHPNILSYPYTYSKRFGLGQNKPQPTSPPMTNPTSPPVQSPQIDWSSVGTGGGGGATGFPGSGGSSVGLPPPECAYGNTGKFIDSKTVPIKFVTLKYAVYECHLKIDVYIFGVYVGTETLHYAKNSVEFKSDTHGAVIKVVLYVENKALYARLESRDRVFGRVDRFGPYKIGSWNSLKF